MTTDIAQMSDDNILARTAWGECRGGGAEGMTSILNVIMNRAAKPAWYGRTPREICLKPWQFSCWDTNDPNYPKLLAVTIADGAYMTALELAGKALRGELADITNGSLYYFAKSMTKWPVWAIGKTPVADIAGQLFFKGVT